jgi:hypothetical protein
MSVKGYYEVMTGFAVQNEVPLQALPAAWRPASVSFSEKTLLSMEPVHESNFSLAKRCEEVAESIIDRL